MIGKTEEIKKIIKECEKLPLFEPKNPYLTTYLTLHIVPEKQRELEEFCDMIRKYREVRPVDC